MLYGLTETVWSDEIDQWHYERRGGYHALWVPTTAVVLYLAMVFALPRFMKNRAAIDLRWPMLVHNFILCTGSLVMTVGILREVRRGTAGGLPRRGRGLQLTPRPAPPPPPVGGRSAAVVRVRQVVDIWQQPNGTEHAVCDPTVQHPARRLYFWYHVFYLSKMYEFIDTLILCLRKVGGACRQGARA